MNVIVNEGCVVSHEIFRAFSKLCACNAEPSALSAVCDGGPDIDPIPC